MEPSGSCGRELDLVALDERVGEELLAHPLELLTSRGRIVAVDLDVDEPTDPCLGDGEPEPPSSSGQNASRR